MTDWREAGRKADAHLVRDLYRKSWSDAKKIARTRVIEAMRAAGVTTVLDLWGGGLSAEELVAAGFRVIAVEDGSMVLLDRGLPVSQARKRRALEYAGAEGGYEVRFGKAETFAAEADGAYLDFCGPWTRSTRRAVAACRHMKCVAVTLTPDHDVSTDAISVQERQLAYQLFLKMAWSGTERISDFLQARGQVRKLLDYRRAGGFAVFLYLLARRRIRVPPLSTKERLDTRPDKRAESREYRRAWWARLTPEQRRQINLPGHTRRKERYWSDSTFQTRERLLARHRKHRPGSTPTLPCELCAAG